MKILITGGAGFIGSHLCARLLRDGHTVTALDNLETGSTDNIEALRDNTNFHFLQQDVADPIDIRVDRIYHLACPASPVHYQRDPIHTLRTCIHGTENMLILAERNHARILHASTSEVYGDPHEHPQRETYWGNVNPIGIRSCYDEGKRAAETLCMDYLRRHMVDVRIVRIFNTYGPHMALNDGRVISNFIVAALRNEGMTVYGDGAQTRSFQYIDDLLRALLLMMEHAGDFHGPVNLGNPKECTIAELAKIIQRLIPESRSVVVHQPLPPDDPRQRRPDIALAKRELQWSPVVPLEEGLVHTIRYFRGALQRSPTPSS